VVEKVNPWPKPGWRTKMFTDDLRAALTILNDAERRVLEKKLSH